MNVVTPHPESRAAIAARLKRLRKTLKLTQAKMAERLSLENQQTWQHYETDKRPLPYEVAQKIGAIWGIPMDWTYRGLTPMLPSMYAGALADPGTHSDGGKETA